MLKAIRLKVSPVPALVWSDPDCISANMQYCIKGCAKRLLGPGCVRTDTRRTPRCRQRKYRTGRCPLLHTVAPVLRPPNIRRLSPERPFFRKVQTSMVSKGPRSQEVVSPRSSHPGIDIVKNQSRYGCCRPKGQKKQLPGVEVKPLKHIYQRTAFRFGNGPGLWMRTPWWIRVHSVLTQTCNAFELHQRMNGPPGP